MPEKPSPALCDLLIPGTDAQIAAAYAGFAARARTERFGAFEDDVVVVDVETTGLSPERDVIIEVGAARLCGPDVVERFTSFVRPGRPVPASITALTGITDSDVEAAPEPGAVVRQLQEFIGTTTVVAHNAAFDRSFLAAATPRPLPFTSDNAWCDSLDLAQIALPRCRSFSLQELSSAFADARTTHRALDDVLGTCQLWRVCLVALAALPPGLPDLLASLFSQSAWPLRPFIQQVAGSLPPAKFSLNAARRQLVTTRPKLEKYDAQELVGGISELQPLNIGELQAQYSDSGLLARMYPGFEPRVEQAEMAAAVATALNTSTHLAVEAGTGVGKSMAYLLPLALFAKRNKVCVGVATKSNSLLDQLVYHELPRLAAELPGGLQYVALKGYDHYPCLRKLMRLVGQTERLEPPQNIANVARLLTYACQSPSGDLDRLKLRNPWGGGQAGRGAGGAGAAKSAKGTGGEARGARSTDDARS
ncbi:MAG: exonuclease domain-containing protein, partial [Coriobacteriia bacterium]|nr:exonuclease domain-containing protein [Coriobacteriia bacterium]